MHGLDLMDTTSLFLTLGIVQTSPAAGAFLGLTLGSLAFARRSPSVQAWLLQDAPRNGLTNYLLPPPTDEQPALPAASWRDILSLPREQPIAMPMPSTASQQPVAPSAALPPLLPALDQAQRVLIIGASNAGKTTLLRHMLDRRQNVLVLDPHAYPGKWGNVRVVGAGRNYEAIRVTLGWLISTMQRRYDEIARGQVREGHHPPMTILVDEWRAIVRNIPAIRADPEYSGKPEPGAGEQIAALLTESRKAAMSMIVASHSDRVKAMGLEGEGDLRDGFTLVRLKLVGSERSCTVDDGDGPVAYTLPGAYIERSLPSQAIHQKADSAPLLSSLLTSTVPVQSAVHMPLEPFVPATVPVPYQYSHETIEGTAMPGTGGTPPSDDDEAIMIRKLLQSFSKNQVAALLGGSKSTAYKRIHRAMEEV